MKETWKMIALLAIAIGGLLAYAFIPEQVAENIPLKQIGMDALTGKSEAELAEEEQADIDMAKKTIVEVVYLIRQNCRGDEILRQYNIEFGFCRNYLGASVWSILFITSICIVNIFYEWLPWWTIIIAFVAQVLLMVGCYFILEARGWAYAKYLFATFIGKK